MCTDIYFIREVFFKSKNTRDNATC